MTTSNTSLPTLEQIGNYIEGALQFPIRNKDHLITMVILHFDISEIQAEDLATCYLKTREKEPVYWNPDFYLH